jgi:hypothetical protein
MTVDEAWEAIKQGRSPAPGEEAAFELALLRMGIHPEEGRAILVDTDSGQVTRLDQDPQRN